MRVRKKFNNFQDKKVLITAGPTREYWDPVRFLTNGASGQMGVALAFEAARRGARVTLILGPTPWDAPRLRKNMRVVRVISALDMDEAVQERLKGTAIFVGAAAVADYRPAVSCRRKIKGKAPTMTLRLLCNPDIIAKVARRGPFRPRVVIGFALETEDMVQNAAAKLRQKGLDWIVANRESSLGAREGSAILLSRWDDRIALGRATKEHLAKRIWKTVLERSPI